METWESKLVGAALAALRGPPALADLPQGSALAAAYRTCAQVTRRHSSSFYWASALLPPEERRAVRALYAFCRTVDDAVDRPGADAAEFRRWQDLALTRRPTAHPVALAWADVRARYRIPAPLISQLLEALSWDLSGRRYETFGELAAYCYGVAGTVGLMTMQIVGYAGPEAVPYAVRLGVALQLTNILRDVGEDARRGRVYLPRAELRAFGLGPAELLAGRVDGRWSEFMAYQVTRARRLYDGAWPGVWFIDRRARLAIAAAADLYRGILEVIEGAGYDVFSRRSAVGTGRKLMRLLRLWWLFRTGGLRSRPPWPPAEPQGALVADEARPG